MYTNSLLLVRIISLLLVVLVFLVTTACSSGDSNVTTHKNVAGGVSLPKALKTALPDNGTLTAYIRVNGGQRQQMSLDGDNAIINISGLTPGSHTFTVEFEFVFNASPNKPFILASATKTHNLSTGNNTLNIAETDYDIERFDEDSDGQSNLDELKNKTNPFAGFSITAISGSTSENATTASFTVVLTIAPTAAVTIGITSSNTTEGSVDKTSVSFDTINWNIAQMITVTGVDDSSADGDIHYAIILAAATSTDTNYNGLKPSDVSVTNIDDDAAEFSISTLSGNTTETGSTATFSVSLSSQPAADVTIGISSSDTTEGTVDKTSLTFTPDDWNTTQIVTVTGVDDRLADGNQAFFIQLAAATSSDAQFDGQNPPDVSVINIDNDRPEFNISPISSNTAEDGISATFTAQLATQPTANVIIGVSSSDTTEGMVDQASITFNGDNWNIPQIITVTGVDDNVDDGDKSYDILLSAAISDDAGYNGQKPDDVAVINTDNDASPTVVLKVDKTSITEADGVAIATVTLSGLSTEDVIVNLSYSGTSTAGQDYTPPTSISIPAGNTTATATITARQDNLDEEDETIMIDIRSVSNGMESEPQQITITIIDDDQPPTLTLSINTASPLAEAAGTANLTATLSEKSGRAVTVKLIYSGTATAGADYNKSDAITIAAGNTFAQAAITAIDDTLDEQDESIIVDIDTVTNGVEVTPQQVTASIIDNDAIPAITFATDSQSVAEDVGTATLPVTLTAKSGFDISAPFTVSGTATGGGTDHNLANGEITIPAGQASSTITFTVQDDALDEASETVIVTLGAPVNATMGTTLTHSITITDNDDSLEGTVSGSTGTNGAQVTIYTFGDPTPVRLGSAVTDETGAYSVGIRSHSRPILIEVSGGSYLEQASGKAIRLSEGQNIRAVAFYQSQQPLNVIVTPLTHLATALAEHNLGKGLNTTQAIENAYSDVNAFFAIDTQSVLPLDITDQSNAQSNLNDAALYGFYLAGVSNWTAWANTKNQVEPHTVYTSMGLAQIAYNDIRADGLLNGVGTNKAGTAQMSLAVGVVPLDADAYRAAFSLHMLAIANGANNKTRIQVNDLKASAELIAERTNPLLGASTPFNLSKQTPVITLTQAVDGYYSGTFSFNVNIGGFLGAERIDISVDSASVGSLSPPTTPLTIDTTNHADGEHQIGLTAVDILGNSESFNFQARFDNTAPVIDVTSAPATNQSTIQLTGNYTDNVAGVQSVQAMEQQATLLDDGTWSTDVQIAPGKNTIPIRVIDLAGNQYNTETVVYLDTIPPTIDSTDKHSQARFSNSDGSFFELVLQDSNPTTPLFLETTTVDLDGVPINRQALNNNTIPFFAFSVTDLMGPDATTAPDKITVRTQYEKNGEIVTDFRELAVVDNEYLVPLVSETLAPNWHQSAPLDNHQIKIEVSDSVGNLSQATFDFRADIYIPETFVTNTNIDVRDLINGVFDDTDFGDRATLNNREFPSSTYTFTNNTGKAFYINPSDSSAHTVEQRVEQLVREHLYQQRASTEWQVGLMNKSDPCPEFIEWKTKTSIYNWTGSAWQLEQVPPSSLGKRQPITSDALPSPAPATAWVDTPDFDQDFIPTSSKTGPNYTSYEFDYVESPTSFTPAAYVTNWIRENNATPPITCPTKRFFQQRQVFANESVIGYPKGTLSEIVVPDTPDFSSSNFTVLNNNTEAFITAVDGWYRIPAGDSITVTKLFTTPALTLHNDDISNVETFDSYTPNLNDKAITWQVNRNLAIAIRHDAGEANIPNMPERSMNTGAGAMNYAISR